MENNTVSREIPCEEQIERNRETELLGMEELSFGAKRGRKKSLINIYCPGRALSRALRSFVCDKKEGG